MTTPFSSASFPSNPTVPTQAPAGYTTPTTPPNPDAINPPVSSEQMDSLRGNLLEMVLRQVAQALLGAFVPGVESAFDQLASWAANIPVIGPLITALTGILNGDLTDLENWAQGIPSTVVDSVALDPGKFFAEAANVTGLTALWVNSIEPFLTQEFGKSSIFTTIDNWVDGVLGVTNNPTGNTGGSLVQAAASTVTDAASTAAANASSAVNSAVTAALTAGGVNGSIAGDAITSVVSTLTTNSATWNLPIPQSIAEFISNITFGIIQFWQGEPGADWVHFYLGPPPNPPAGIPASWHQNLDGTTPPPVTTPPPTGGSTGDSGADGSTDNLPIPAALADFLTKITGGYLSFWWANDGSWIHGHEPIGGTTWQQTHVNGPNGGTALAGSSPTALAHPAIMAAASAVTTLTSSNSSTWNLPIPQPIAEFISNITFGCIQFWEGSPGADWVHFYLGAPPNPPAGIPASWHENLDGTATPVASPANDVISNAKSNLLAVPAVAAVTSAVANALSGGSPTAATGSDAVTSTINALTSNTNPAWNLPIPQSIAELISNITFGVIQFWQGEPGADWVHFYLGPPPNPPAGIPASWHENLNGTPPVTKPPVAPPPSDSSDGTAGLPIPSWLASILSTITFGYLSFWWADDGSWIHGGEPIGGTTWQGHHVSGPPGNAAVNPLAAPAANIASNLTAMAAPAVAAVASAANAAAPAKGLTGEVSSVFENLLGLFSNPSGSSLGSIITGAISQITSGASSNDVMSNITSGLVQAFTDAAAGLPWGSDISSRFGDSSLGQLLTDIVGILTNTSGSSDGSIPQSIWQKVWSFINCNGLTGNLFSAGNNLTGLLGNPTGASKGGALGTLTGYVTDLSNVLFSHNGKGLAELVSLAQELARGDVLSALGDALFGNVGDVLTSVIKDVGGILNFFSSPTLPSPNALAAGAQTAAATVASSAASAIGLGNSTGGISGAVANFTSDFMGTLGNPNGLGTGNVTLNALDNIPILGPILEMLFSGLGGSGTATHTGVLGILDSIPLIGPLIEELPSLLASIIGPGANPTLLPDANFATLFGADVQGQGDWAWAWPGKDGGAWGGPGCIRTVRPGLITVYFVTGTWEILPGITSLLGFQSGGAIEGDPIEYLKALASSTGFQDGVAPGDSRLDWSRFELVVVPYGGATYPMGETEAQGVAELQSLIQSTPGKFVIIGHSQGGCVVSDVYDSLRTGTMQDRNDDLVMGVGIGNMRHQKGTAFPGGPVYCPDGAGCFTPLQNTEERWWEWAVAAGTYPGNGELDGVTYPDPDPVSCLGTDATSEQVRKLIATTMAAKSINIITMVEEVFSLLTSAGGKELMNGLSGHGPHNSSPFEVQPFLAQGDTRSFWEYMLDGINALDTDPPPPGMRHQLESKPISVAPGAVVAIGAYTKWMNVDCRGPAIMVGLNCYDASGNMIATDSSYRDPAGNLIVSVVSNSTTIRTPVSDSDGWQNLTDQFVIPANTAVATLVFNVEPAAMTTGIVAFDNAQFVITSGTIDAGQLGNIGGIPSVPAENVGGIQNAENSLVTMQGTLDGLTSAFSGDSLTDVAFSQAFSAASKIASATRTALDALPQIHDRLVALETAAGIPSPPIYQGPEETEFDTSGTHMYEIPAWMEDGDKIAVAILGAGAGGKLNKGGTPGSWAGQILTKGTDFPSGTTELTVVIGSPGGALAVFPFNFPGDFGATGDGDPSTVSATGMTTITAAGGSAGAGTSASGLGPGSFAITGSPLGKTYFGGPTVSAGSTGAAPGGAGAGAGTAPGSHAAPGAVGYGSITAYQAS